jgi:iron complex outermembrane receptor protein
MKQWRRGWGQLAGALALAVAVQASAAEGAAEAAGDTSAAGAPVAAPVAAAAPAGDTSTAYNFEEYVVTTTKGKLKVKDSPAAASVVTQADIAKKSVVYADDLVNDLPGTQVLHPQIGATSGTVVSMRGIPNVEKNLILLDGHSIQNTMNANTWWNRVPIDLVDHVEVVRGPFSALYGERAVGGVINIITAEPQGESVNLGFDYQSIGARTLTLNYRDKPASYLSYYFGLTDQVVDGYTNHAYVQAYALTYTATAAGTVKGYKATTDPQGKAIYNLGELAPTLTRNDSFTGKIYFTPVTDQVFTLSGNYAFWDQPTAIGQTGETWLKDSATGKDSPSNGIYTLAGTTKEIKISQSNFYTAPGQNGVFSSALTYKGKFSDLLSLSADVEYDGGNYYKSATAIDPGSTALSGTGNSGSQTPNDNRFLENLQTFLNLPANKIVIGVENNQDNDRNYTLTSHNWAELDQYQWHNENRNSNERISAAYAQDELRLLDPLTVYIGGRFDNWNSTNGQAWDSKTGSLLSYPDKSASVFSPKLSLVYKLGDSARLRASAGSAFDPPMPLQLYSWTAGTTGGIASVTVGNPDLQPELDKSWEFGGEWDLPTSTHLSATYFENYLSNLIYQSSVPGTGNTLITYYNAGQATAKGVETELKQQVTNNLGLFANYTYASSIITANTSVPNSVGKFIPGVAEHSAHAGIDFHLGKLQTILDANYSSKVYRQADNSDYVNGVQGSYDPFAVVNLRFNYALINGGVIHAGVNNLFDNKYYAIYQQVGRYYDLGATLSLF